MSFNSNKGRQSFTAVGGQTNFDFNFKIYEVTDVKIYLTPTGNSPDDVTDLLTYGSDYTITIDGDDGGTLILTSAATLDDIIVTERDLPRTRGVSYVTQGDLRAATLNEDQDYQTYLLIDDFNSADRAMYLPSTDVNMSTQLPATKNGYYLRVNADGTSFEYSPSAIVLSDVNTFVVANVDDLLVLDVANIGTVIVSDHDRGGIFTYDPSLSTTNNNGTIFNGWVRQYEGAVNVKWFDAKGDGVTDDTVAIQAACNVGDIHIPKGKFKIESAILIPSNHSVFGISNVDSIIDISTSVSTDFAYGCIRTADPIFVALPGLTSNIKRGQTKFSFVSAHGLEVGDIFSVDDYAENSYSGARGYSNGEYLKVDNVIGNDVFIDGMCSSDYILSSTVVLHKMTNTTTARFENFQILGNLSTASGALPNMNGLGVIGGVNCSIVNVKVLNVSAVGIMTKQCYNTSIKNCNVELGAYQSGYGISIFSCHITLINGGRFDSMVHGISIGGFSGGGIATIGFPVNRFTTVTNARVLSNLDSHGLSEYTSFINNIVDRGINCGGDHIKIIGNTIRKSADTYENGTAVTGDHPIISLWELKGATINISDNDIIAFGNVAQGRGTFIDSQAFGSDTQTEGGTVIISNNSFKEFDNNIVSNPIEISKNGATAETFNTSIILSSNSFSTNNKDFVNSGYVYFRSDNDTTKFSLIDIQDNTFENIGGVQVRHIDNVSFKGNTFVNTGTPLNGVSIQKTLKIEGNSVVDGNGLAPFYATGNITDTSITCTDNKIHNNFRITSSDSRQKAICYFVNAKDVIVQNNYIADRNKTLSMDDSSSFTDGETITGSSSGATAEMLAEEQSTRVNVGETITGAFTDGETITGGTSGASTTLTTVLSSQTYRASFITVDTLWVKNNVCSNDALGYKYTGVTSVNSDFSS